MTSQNAAGNAAAASAASQTTPSSSSSDNLGKFYLVVQGLSALMGVAGAASNRSSANTEAQLLNDESELALQEASILATQKAREVRSFRENQAQAYNNSGVLLEGSPMVVLSDTVRKGNEEIDAIMKRGQAMANIMRTRAQQTRNAGNSGLLSSILTGGLGLASAAILGKRIGMFGNSAPAVQTPAPTPSSLPGIDVSLPQIQAPQTPYQTHIKLPNPF